MGVIDVSVVDGNYVLIMDRSDFYLLCGGVEEHLLFRREKFDVLGCTYQQANAWMHEFADRTREARDAMFAARGRANPIYQNQTYLEIRASVERRYPPDGEHIQAFRERAGGQAVDVEIRDDGGIFVVTVSPFEYLLLARSLREHLDMLAQHVELGNWTHEQARAWLDALDARVDAAGAANDEEPGRK